MKDTYYFPHDNNASHDEKITFLLKKFGLEGYGMYWLIIEMMHASSSSKLKRDLIEGYVTYNTDISVLKDFIETCIKIGLFNCDDQFYWSERVLRNKEDLDKKRLLKSMAGRKGMSIRWKHNTVIPSDNKGKESKGKESKDLEDSSEVSKTKPSEPPSPVFLTFPTVGSKKEWNLTEKKVEEFMVFFPGVDVRMKAKEALSWCINNPSKRKTYNGMTSFIHRWMSKEQNRFSSKSDQQEELEPWKKEVYDKIERSKLQANLK